MNNHVMIDIETLGTTADTVVLSIGAVRFDPMKPDDNAEAFYAVLDVEDQLAIGRTVSHSTFCWWMRQSKEARIAIAGENVKAVPANEALDDLRKFIPKKVEGVWGNGSDFDNAILQHMNGQFDPRPLWPFRANRCFRTFTKLFDPMKHLQPVANDHNALNDCWNQIYWMHNICAEHGVEV